ncbi:MAG: hypothetical protein IAE92_00560 [Burkholderiaceae bacterium]|nr:hypothetical protein [Burkholderiaceae bacterium]
MPHPAPFAATLIALAITSPPLLAADNATQLQQLQQEIAAMRKDYEAQLKALEARLKQAETSLAAQPATDSTARAPTAASAPTAAESPPATQTATMAPATAQSSASAFNPAIALILSGSYSSFSQDPTQYRIPGFLAGGEIGPGVQGFSLGESELTLSATIDPWFFGSLNLALAADNSASVEEAFIQTTSLPGGLGLKAGRYLASIGYQNDKHPHAWDFINAPLAYQVFLGGALTQDGLQFKAVLPTSQFVELGGGIGAAGEYPSGTGNLKKPGTATLFAHTGGDIGASQSWRAGASMVWANALDRASDDIDIAGNPVSNVFTGNSRLAILDGVWKWSPDGNAKSTSVTLQGEYFHRTESGSMIYDASGQALADIYRSAQSGWYAQAVYKFLPAWRVGLRYDRLDLGSVNASSNTANLFLPEYSPNRTTLMFDWSPSEYSRVRLQLAQDRARYGLTDNQIMIQYQMSLGSHGAHAF